MGQHLVYRPDHRKCEEDLWSYVDAVDGKDSKGEVEQATHKMGGTSQASKIESESDWSD